MKPAALTVALVLACVLSSCDRFRSGPTPQAQGERIVCVSKQLTEMLFDLGAGGHIVGVDLSSTYPPEATKLPTVGYHRLLSAEGITSLHPTVVFHDGNVAPDAVLKQLTEVGIPIREFRADNTIEGTKGLMKTLGDEFHVPSRADSLCRILDEDLYSAQQKRSQYTTIPRVLILHFGRVVNNYLVIGQRGTASLLLDWAGARNAVDAPEGMKPLSAELVAASRPDVILLTDFGYDRLGSVDAAKQLPGVALTAAARNNKIYRIEEHDIVYFGPRTGKIVLDLMDLVHR